MTRHTYFRFTAPAPATTAALNWRAHAACLDVDPEAMFPGTLSPDIASAKSICDTCPVVAECLGAALAEEGATAKDNRWGVRGGLTGEERHNLYRQTQRRARK